jgi:fluoroacetyl-CoA thioesterase
MPIAVGLRASVRVVVSESDTAAALGSGDVPVLGTPRLLALAEAAAVAAVAPQLTPGDTTVGTLVTIEHRRASPVGSSLVIEAELTEVDGPRLVFSFIARRDDFRAQPPGAQPPGAQAPAARPGAQAPAALPPEDPAAEDPPPSRDEHVVGAGTIERVVVARERFLARAYSRRSGTPPAPPAGR